MSEADQRLIEKIPKVEQHIHIVGSIRPRTLRWLAVENDIHVPELVDPKRVNALFHYKDFGHFIDSYTIIMSSIRKEKQFERIVYEMLEDEARQNVKYVEASFSAPDHTRLGLDYFETLKAINRGIERARLDYAVECNLKLDLVRDYGAEVGTKHLDLMSEYRERVVAIDIGGREHACPAVHFAPVYRRAREMGLHLTAHAGEACGPESIWDAVKYLLVERIGHGVAARRDPALVEHLRKNDISIEMCPVSNLRTGVVDDIRNHPIGLFFRKGLKVTANSDDPTMFATNMNNEYRTLNEQLGFSLRELFRLSLNAVESSFLDEDEKAILRRTFHKEFEKLK